MVYTFVTNIVYLNFNSIFNILNAIMTNYRFLSFDDLNLIFLNFFSYKKEREKKSEKRTILRIIFRNIIPPRNM